ncbi:hypothetical protein BK147_31135 [Paenibacillus sp. FSL R7-0337]|nr:hypothetical protein BK147_31135 [Paenibacillus sp. FSL R7-0337]
MRTFECPICSLTDLKAVIFKKRYLFAGLRTGVRLLPLCEPSQANNLQIRALESAGESGRKHYAEGIAK